MKKSKFTEEQMVRILREADEKGVTATSKKHGISDQTLYVKKLKALEAENAKLKKLVAEQMLALEVMKEVNAKRW